MQWSISEINVNTNWTNLNNMMNSLVSIDYLFNINFTTCNIDQIWNPNYKYSILHWLN